MKKDNQIMKKDNQIIIKKQNLISYLDSFISSYEERIQAQEGYAAEDRQRFRKNILLFISEVVIGLCLDLFFAGTLVMIPIFVITTPFIFSGVLGLPTALLVEIDSRREYKKSKTLAEKLVDAAKKRKQYEMKLLGKMKTPKKAIDMKEIMTDLIKDEPLKTHYSSVNNSELDELLLNESSRKKKLEITTIDKKSQLKEEKHQKQELSYDEELLTYMELKTYALAIKPLLKAKMAGRLEEFLSEKCDVNDPEAIAMYDALLEEELSGADQIQRPEITQNKEYSKKLLVDNQSKK